jgi:cytochrome bd-type quinol oxidase subunit 2
MQALAPLFIVLLALLLTSLFFQVRRQIYRRRVQRRLMEVCFPASATMPLSSGE